MNRSVRAYGVGLMLLAAALLPRPALAQDPNTDAAREHFAKGVELFEKDDFVGALEQFEIAGKTHRSPTITYNIARARESLGQAQAAYDAYEAYIGEAGAQAEFLDAATVALSRIKARSTRLRVETEPQGAVVRVDGMIARDKSPSTMLVFRGLHRVEVELEGWIDARDVVAEGAGSAATVRLLRPKAEPKAAAPAPAPTRAEHVFTGLTAGIAFSLNYSALVVKANPTTDATTGAKPPEYKTASVMFGLVLETGYAFNPRTAVMLRGNCGLGETSKARFSLGSLSLALSWRATPRWWVGGGGIMGSTKKDLGATYSPLVGATVDDSIEFVSNPALGPMVEAGLVLADNDYGQWVLSIFPSLLLGTGQGQSTLYVPLAIGHRWY
ncbi:MAG: PEGA domain-containing protein [Deltaproteobacteria bacterium]|nr:PEGA domain-containing protein [Deltaproteobacteria bacterium]